MLFCNSKIKKYMIHTVYLKMGIAVIFIAVLLLGCGNRKAYRIIHISEISGNVSIVEENKEYEAYKGMRLQEGHTIVTSGNSYTRMVLDDDKYIKLEEGSRASVNTLANGRTEITLERGAITNEIIKPLYEGQSYIVHTPNATLAVRGTFFRVELGNSNEGDFLTKVYTYGGSVVSQRKLPNGDMVEEAVTIGEGYRATISMDQVETIYLEEPVNEVMEQIIPMYPETIVESDLIDMYFASQKGHEMFVPAGNILDILESRSIDIDSFTSAYDQASSLGVVGKGTAPDDNFPMSVNNTGEKKHAGHHAPFDGEKETISEQFKEIIESIIPGFFSRTEDETEEEIKFSDDNELAQETENLSQDRDMAQAETLPDGEKEELHVLDSNGEPDSANRDTGNSSDGEDDTGGEEELENAEGAENKDLDQSEGAEEEDSNQSENVEEDKEPRQEKDDNMLDEEDKDTSEDSDKKENTSSGDLENDGDSSYDSGGSGGSGATGNSCSHSNTEEVTTEEATCTTAGKKVKRCKSCGKTIKTTTIPATGHVEHPGPMTMPNCTDEGEQIISCLVCMEEIRREILPATGHTWDEIDRIAATCQEGTKITKQCIQCSVQETTTDDDIQPHDPNEPSKAMTLCSYDTCMKKMINYGSTEFDPGLGMILETYERYDPTGYLMEIEAGKELNDDSLIYFTIDTNYNITDLAGLEHLPTKELSVISSGLQSLNPGADNNDLEKLSINGCYSFTTLKGSPFLSEISLINTPALTSIDVSPCTGLETINISNCKDDFWADFNATGLSRLKIVNTGTVCTDMDMSLIPNKSAIKNLSLSDSSALLNLNVAGLTGLESLNIDGLSNLTGINASGCTGLNTLNIEEDSNVKTLNLSNTAVNSISNLSRLASLETLNISECKSLSSVTLPTGFLTEVNAQNATGLRTLNGNSASRMTTLNLEGCTGLQMLNLSDNYALTSLDVSTCTALEDLSFKDNSQVTSLDLSNCTNLESLSVISCSEISTLDFNECTGLKYVYVNYCDRVTSLDFTGFDNLVQLDLKGCTGLTSLDVSDCISLQKITITGSGITETNIVKPVGVDIQIISN